MESEQNIRAMARSGQVTSFAAALHREANIGLNDDNYGVAISSAGIRVMVEQWTDEIRTVALRSTGASDADS